MKISRLLGPLLLVAAAAAGSFALDLRGARPALALTNCSVSDFSNNAEEQAFLNLINTYRAQNGAPALAFSSGLNRMASWHAEDMAGNNYFSHTDSFGREFGTRLGQCDASGGAAGENIAAGYQSAQDVFNAWRNSSGHNANMLNPTYRYVGVARVTGGYYGVYWATDFSSTNPSAGSGGATSPTPTPTPPVTQTKASITSPQNGSTLSGASVTFNWSAGSGADEYFLYVGTSQGANNIYGGSQALNRSRNVSNLPTNGSTVYVRLWTRFGSSWQYNDTSYTAATTATQPATKAAMVSPAPGSRLPGTTVTFDWSEGSGAQEYFLYVGSSRGGNNFYAASTGMNSAATVSGLPRNGSTVYVRLWTRTGTGWQYTDYTYRAAR